MSNKNVIRISHPKKQSGSRAGKELFFMHGNTLHRQQLFRGAYLGLEISEKIKEVLDRIKIMM